MGYEPETYRSNLLKYLDILAKCNDKGVLKYGELRMKESEVKAIKETKKLLNKAIPHEHKIEKSFKLQSKDVQINPMQMQEGKIDMGKALDAGLVVIESSVTTSDKQDTGSKSGNNTTHVVDADTRPVNDQEPLAEVDSNTTPDSTNMSINGGKIDQEAEQYHVKSLALQHQMVSVDNTLGPTPQRKMTFDFRSGLGLHQMTSKYFRLELSFKENKNTTGTPSSILVDQDAPSTSTSPTTEDTQAPVLHQDVEGQETPNA
ncbi:hypothetical protein Tco_0285103 [Tanacetum coccineum]